jgi:hypothetical protein
MLKHNLEYPLFSMMTAWLIEGLRIVTHRLWGQSLGKMSGGIGAAARGGGRRKQEAMMLQVREPSKLTAHLWYNILFVSPGILIREDRLRSWEGRARAQEGQGSWHVEKATVMCVLWEIRVP